MSLDEAHPERHGGLLRSCLPGPGDGRAAGEITGAWLVWYDPAGNDGNGDAAWSHDPAEAARFADREWAELYAAAPVNRPRRLDGQPNRPITVFNLAIVPVRPGGLPSVPPDPAGRLTRAACRDLRRVHGPA